jgi:anti-anti-sigma regulatory factor
VLGDKEQRLDRERQEFLAAKLQRDQCQYAISSLELDLADLKYKLSALGNLDSAYQALLERKEKILLSSENDLFHQLLDITGLQANLQADRKELQEAVGAGQTVLTILDGVINSLNSAEGWGNWDMLGGGMLADLAKHSKIDDARDQVHQAQELLRRFQRELADIQSAESFLIDISSFDTFVDFFLDSLIVDWIVQSKIHNSLERTTQVRQRVKAILQGLGTRLAENRGQLDNLIEQRKLLVENS